MKIICTTTSQVPAGTANSIQVMKTCQALAQCGHDVRLLVPRSGGLQPAGWDALAAHYGLVTPFEVQWLETSPVWKRYDLAWKGVQAAASARADLLYTWMLQSAALGLRRGIPTALELHDRITGRVGPLLFRAVLTSKTPKRLLIITRALRQALERQFHAALSDGQVVIAPNGSEPERYANLPTPPEARRALGLPERETAVYSGHFYAGRGMDLLLGLARAFPQVGFLWVGGTPEHVARWGEKLAAEGLANVMLTGFIDNARLPHYLAAGDVLLMPYERQIAGSSGGNSADICSPMKMFDYLAAGRAILTSDLPVLHEVLSERNAAFCPPEDQPAWQAGLRDLLSDPGRRASLAAQAVLDAQGYTWRARAERALAGMRLR